MQHVFEALHPGELVRVYGLTEEATEQLLKLVASHARGFHDEVVTCVAAAARRAELLRRVWRGYGYVFAACTKVRWPTGSGYR